MTPRAMISPSIYVDANPRPWRAEHRKYEHKIIDANGRVVIDCYKFWHWRQWRPRIEAIFDHIVDCVNDRAATMRDLKQELHDMEDKTNG